MRRPSAQGIVLLATLWLAGALAPRVDAQESAVDPWAELQNVRTALIESPQAADFVQTYTPAGFSTGDEERGYLHLGLPACLRWDYEEPYPRSYLLCNRTVWAWSPDEERGDRYLNVPEDEAGLDFLLLSTERLRNRYDAEARAADNGNIVLELVPKAPESTFSEARIELDPSQRQPVRFSYADREGNRTSFTLTLFRPLEDPTHFTPPQSVEWIDG